MFLSLCPSLKIYLYPFMVHFINGSLCPQWSCSPKDWNLTGPLLMLLVTPAFLVHDKSKWPLLERSNWMNQRKISWNIKKACHPLYSQRAEVSVCGWAVCIKSSWPYAWGIWEATERKNRRSPPGSMHHKLSLFLYSVQAKAHELHKYLFFTLSP